MFSLYGFYDYANNLIEIVPSISKEEAKEWFKENYPDTDYLYIQVIRGTNNG